MSAPDAEPAHHVGTAADEARHVFISFASEDLELAHRVVQRLERSGFRCWISDRDIEPAASYPAAITAAVGGCGALLLLLTDSANRSPHVVREIELAFNARAPILPVRISGVLPSSDLLYFLSTTQWFDAGSTVDDADYSKVESRLRDLLRRAQGTSTGGIEGRRRWLLAGAGAALLAAVAAALLFTNGRRDNVPQAADAASNRPTEELSRVPAEGGAATSPGIAPKVNPRDGQTYVWVPPGRFVMGCSAADPACEDDEKPAHAVEVRTGFWLARTEVTNAQYRKTTTRGTAARTESDEELPVTGVAWAAARMYCASVGGRLPSEAEWEYAARGGTSTRYYDTLTAVAWFADNAESGPQRVGAKAPNPFGLHDMLGNVSEWVRDRYYNAYDDSAEPPEIVEPLAPNASGVARGGSWLSDAQGVRVSSRLEMPPDAEEPHVGFRCAIDRL